MRVVIIGGSGHIGSYLAPRLVGQGHEAINVTRGQRQPYRAAGEWRLVRQVTLDRGQEESAGTFGSTIRDLEPDVVVDLICFTLESARHLVEALQGQVRHFLHCGTIWVHGPSEAVPTTEAAPRNPFGDYGINKAGIEDYLLQKARREGFPATVLHPGHIVGPGWLPINPAGNLNRQVFERLAAGEEILLPDQGLYTLHHVHADDVAQGFQRAIESWSAAVGESFHMVSPQALTLRGYAAAVARWFGQEPRLKYLPWEEWKAAVPEEDAGATWDHILHSPCASMEKAKCLLGYQPRYTSLEAIREALDWSMGHGEIRASWPG